LIGEGALIEDDACGLGTRGRGRPWSCWRLNPEYTHVVGVKIATHQIVFSVTDFVGNVAASDNIPVEALKSHRHSWWSSSFAGPRLPEEGGQNDPRVSGIGVACLASSILIGNRLLESGFRESQCRFSRIAPAQI